MNLVIDRGNTQIKLGIFDQCRLVYSDYTNFLDEKMIAKITSFGKIEKVIVSSVVTEEHTQLLNTLNSISSSLIELSHQTPLPFNWNYQSKETIGKDRLAAIAGAINLYPKTNLLVIDAGTAITYEIIDKNNTFLGGNIAPGMNMRFKALHQFTSKLPHVEPNENSPLYGTSTHEAIRAGVQNGVFFEIDGLINEIKKQFDSLKVIITGGDADFFARKLKNPIFVHPNLVLIGLNRILEHNAQYI